MLESRQTASGLRDYLHIARRRKWVILLAAVLVPASAIAFSLQQQKLYEATSEVLLSRQNLAAALTDTPDVTLAQDAARLVETQATLAQTETVAERTLKAAGVTDRTPEEFLESSSVSGKTNADILRFTVTDPSETLARKLSAEYAEQYTIYRRELDTRALQEARASLERRLDELRARGQEGSALYANLVEKEEELRTVEALQTANAKVVRAATEAELVQPKLVRNIVLAVVLGLILGIGLAFLWESLDTRVRTADEVEEILGMPLLARVPEPPRHLRRKNKLVMLAEPGTPPAEAFRVLRTNLEFVNLERDAKTIMVTSAVETEGKSTTASNLAISLARGGKRVALVDLDFRRPFLGTLFGLNPEYPGLTDVALGKNELDDAILAVTVSGGITPASAAYNGNASFEGVLQLLATGPVPPNAGEFVATRALARIVEQLRARADIVIVDAPPLLHVADALTLATRVDALVIVARLNYVRRPALLELARVLDSCPTPRLGFVATGAAHDEAYGYGYGYGYGHAHPHEPAPRRRPESEPSTEHRA